MSVSLHGLTGLAVYLVVFGIVFAESGLLLGFFLPGDTVLFAAGLLAADRSAGVRLPVLVVGVVVLAVAGDSVGYAFGRRAGRPLLARRDGRLLNQANVARARTFYARFGAGAVVAARFVPWVRTFTPILAGVAEMRYPVFLAANVVGALVWGAGLLVLGYAAASIPLLRHASYAVAVAVVALSAVPGLVRWRRSRGASRRR
ncbi:MAG: DedA family protein [Actinomycetota bacterium]|nr:DedA family protein [Actinomycetota bacterium]